MTLLIGSLPATQRPKSAVLRACSDYVNCPEVHRMRPRLKYACQDRDEARIFMAGTPDRAAARPGAAAELNLQNCALIVHSVRCAACFPPHAELPRKLVETTFLDRGPDAQGSGRCESHAHDVSRLLPARSRRQQHRGLLARPRR